MADRDAAAACVEALATYLSGALSGVSVLRGWPESDTPLDLEAGPVLAVVEVPGGDDEVISPSILGGVVDGAVTVQTGVLRIALQLDLFCAYREVLDAQRRAVDEALSNALPFRPHLYLTATDYHARPFTVVRGPDRPDIDGETAQRGEWRHTWTLRAEIERVQSVTMAALSTISTPLTDPIP